MIAATVAQNVGAAFLGILCLATIILCAARWA